MREECEVRVGGCAEDHCGAAGGGCCPRHLYPAPCQHGDDLQPPPTSASLHSLPGEYTLARLSHTHSVRQHHEEELIHLPETRTEYYSVAVSSSESS